MKPVLLRQAAVADVEEAFQWYETQRSGLGAEFRESLRDTLNRIAVHPDPIRLSTATHAAPCSSASPMVCTTASTPT